MYVADNLIPEGSPKPEEVTWYHPEDIIKGRIAFGEDLYEIGDYSFPQFIHNGANLEDVRQSKYLGDCWFISALCLVCSNDQYLIGEFDPLANTDDKIDAAEAQGMTTGIWPVKKEFILSRWRRNRLARIFAFYHSPKFPKKKKNPLLFSLNSLSPADVPLLRAVRNLCAPILQKFRLEVRARRRQNCCEVSRFNP